jgi:hypothetical protein
MVNTVRNFHSISSSIIHNQSTVVQAVDEHILSFVQLLLFVCVLVLAGFLGVIINLNGYPGFVSILAIPSIIVAVLVILSISLAMKLINSSNFLLILGPGTEAKWTSSWTLANYDRAVAIIFPTTLSVIVFRGLCAFAGFSIPTALEQLFTGIVHLWQLV